MIRTVFRVVAVLLVLAIAAVGGLAYTVWNRVHTPFQGFDGERFVELPAGSSSREIGRRLADAGVVPDPWTFRAALWWTGRARGLQAGEYRFDAAASPLEVVDRLVRGDVYELRLTFPEGLTIDDMASEFEARHLGTAAAFREAARDVSLVASLDPAARDLEGYLFPETYPLTRHTGAADLVRTMVERFKAVYAEAAKDHDLHGLSVRQIVTLASLVEKETARSEERPLVAAVYRNRLALNMGMQADPTVIYALRKRGHYDGNIRKTDLTLDSPYNTYRYRGLPPGPIASPGRASLEAALAPADAKYLYFVSRNDGSHVFAETLTQHNANVQKYQVDFFRAAKREPPQQTRSGASGKSGGSGGSGR